MTYHKKNGLGEVGTYKNYGTGVAEFRVSGLSGTSADSAKALAKILAMVKAVPGVLSADAAWIEGGLVKATFRAAEGTPVDATAATIRRNATSLGKQIRDGATVTVTSTRFVTANINRTAAVAPTSEAPAVAPDAAPAPVTYASSGGGEGLGTGTMVGLGIAGVLVLGGAAYFMLRKKPATPTVNA